MLADDLLIQSLFQPVEPLPFLLTDPFRRNAAGLRHHMGDLFPGQAGVQGAFPFGPDARRRTGFVHKVDGFVRQAPPRQIPHRQLHRFPKRFLGQADAVIPLVPRRKPFQDRRGLLGRGFLDLDFPEPAFQRGVLLDVGAKFLIRRRADKLQFAPCQNGFQDARSINSTLGGTGPHDGVKLIHKQDRTAIPDQLFEQILEPLLKVAPVLGSGDKACHVQREKTPAQQHPGNLFVGDALGQPFRQCGLSDARLPDQTGIIFLAAA